MKEIAIKLGFSSEKVEEFAIFGGTIKGNWIPKNST